MRRMPNGCLRGDAGSQRVLPVALPGIRVHLVGIDVRCPGHTEEAGKLRLEVRLLGLPLIADWWTGWLACGPANASA